MLSFFGSLVAVYVLMVVWMTWHWTKAKLSRPNPNFIPEKKISVLVPFRNEAQHLPVLLKDLAGQHFPENLREILFINDNSNDSGTDIVNAFCKSHRGCALLDLQSGTGKKAALETGLLKAEGQLIVTLDADMRIGPEWLSSISQYWETSGKQFLILPISIGQTKGFLSLFQTIEMDSLIGTTGAFALAQRPIMCNGGNLAFEKKLFHSLGGYQGNERVASGDDIFLLQKCHRTNPEAIGWLHSPGSIATTAPSPSLPAFLNQRIRWGAKTKYYTYTLPQMVAVLVALANLGLAAAWVLLLSGLISWRVPVGFFILKAMADGLFLWSVGSFFNHRSLFWAYPLVALTYPFYITIAALTGLFWQPRWKGRKV